MLSSIADIRMGATLRGLDATRPVPLGNYELVRIGDVSQDGVLLSKSFPRISPKQPVSEQLFLRSGDILFPNRGTRTTAVVYRRDAGPTIAGAQFFILRPKLEDLLPEYLAWYLRTEKAAAHFEGRRKGSYVQILERRDVAELQVPVPPLIQQQKIVAIVALALSERKLTERLLALRWKLVNQQLSECAKSLTNRINPTDAER